MPYLLHVVKGKEKRVIEVFGHHGVAAKKALIGEYVVTYDPEIRGAALSRFHLRLHSKHIPDRRRRSGQVPGVERDGLSQV